MRLLLRTILSRAWAMLTRERLDREFDEELSTHLELLIEEGVRSGLSPADARCEALRRLGRPMVLREAHREQRGLPVLDVFTQDLRYALRSMRHAPTLTIVVIATLAIAIGANTAIFSLVDAVLLRTLPVERPDQLRELEWTARRGEFSTWYNGDARKDAGGDRVFTSFAYPIYAHVRDHTTTFSDLFCFGQPDRVNVSVGGRAELTYGMLVAGNFMRGLGVEALIGRTITPDDDRADAPAVAVLSFGFWQRIFGGDAAVLGQTMTVNGTPAVIIGVTSPAFRGISPGRSIDVMVPMATLQPAIYPIPNMLRSSRHWGFRVMGRLKTDTSEQQARAETEALVRQGVLADPPPTERYDLPHVTLNAGGQGLDTLRRTFARPLGILMALVGAVLLIACANIAGLLLTRATARQREIAVRLALGAGRARLFRQFLTESVLLALIGGGLGIALAFGLRNLLPRLLTTGAEGLDLDMTVDLRPLAFSTAICLFAGLLTGLLPAYGATRVDVAPMLPRATSNATDRSSRLWTGKALVFMQVALSCVLLVGAGLFVRSLINLRSQSLGFRPKNLLLFQMDATLNGYKERRLNDLYEDATKRVAAVPGVRSVSLSRHGILSGRTTDGIRVSGQGDQGRSTVSVHVHYVGPKYFGTMGIPLVAGRDIAWRDREDAPRVAIMNQALAQRAFPADTVLGSRIGYPPDTTDDIEIVGVVANATFGSLREVAPPTLYLPYRQYRQHMMTFAVRAAGDATALMPSIRRAVAEIDPNVPPFNVRTQARQIDLATLQERLFAQLVSGFALMSVLLACLGLYATLAYQVTRRTPEIGLRMALGAKQSKVVQMVLRESLVPVAAGVAVGLATALAVTRIVRTMLFGLTPRDTSTFLIAALVMLVSALLAAWLPSRRASHVDPMFALRSE